MIEATELIGVRVSSDGAQLRLRVRDQAGRMVTLSPTDQGAASPTGSKPYRCRISCPRSDITNSAKRAASG